MFKTHNLKILPEHFANVVSGVKTFEVRFNDRDYKVGDLVLLREFDNGEYTGREIVQEICYILDNPSYCKKDFVILGIRHPTQRRMNHEAI